MWIGHCKDIQKADVSSVSPSFRLVSLERIKELLVTVWFMYKKMELRYWLHGAWWCEKQQNKLAEWKAFIDTVMIKSADLKNKFLF